MSTIYVLKEGQKAGPFTTEELEGHVEAGIFSREDLFWTEGMDEWQPLATVLETPPASPDETGEPEDILYETEGAVLTASALHLAGAEAVPLAGITKVGVQTEKVKRAKPVAGCIVLGVVIVVLALLELPRSTTTHWVLWGGLLLVLILWWFRFLLRALQIPATLVVIDLQDGDERLIRSKPRAAEELCQAITGALEAEKL